MATLFPREQADLIRLIAEHAVSVAHCLVVKQELNVLCILRKVIKEVKFQL